MRIVIKLGGHLLQLNSSLNRLSAYADTLKRIKGLSHNLAVVAGGGRVARDYIEAARGLGASEFLCDIIGIGVARLNARLLIAGLGGDAFPEVVTTFSELRTAYETGDIVLMGGVQPGQSTNAVGILSAEAVRADLFINATDVDGVYTADPKECPNARRLEMVRTDELMRIILSKEAWAGGYALFDPVAIKIVERSRIPTRIIDGRNPDNIERAVKGESLGTLLRSSLKAH